MIREDITSRSFLRSTLDLVIFGSIISRGVASVSEIRVVFPEIHTPFVLRPISSVLLVVYQ